MDWRAIALLAHVLAAFWWIAGYVGTNLCTEIARRSTTDEECRSALLISNRLDRTLNQMGGTFAGLTGLVALVVFGYSVFTPWVAASIVLFALVVVGGAVFWRRYGMGIDTAVAAGDWETVRRRLREPRIVGFSRLENIAVVAIIALMVLRPGAAGS
jgi:uncharacterized membrane protein